MSGGIPWAPQGRPDNTIAQMILQAGRDRAEGLRRGSAITANALGSLGDIAQGYYQQKREDKDKALKLSMLMEDRQRAQKLGDLQYQGEQIDLEKKKKEQEQDALVSNLLSSGQPPTMETMTKAGVDPQRAMAISTGFMSLQAGALRRFGDINELQKATARGILALPEAQRPQAYDIALQSYKTNGIDTSHIPPQYDPGAVEAAAGYGEDPVAKKQAEEDRKYNRSRDEAADKRAEAHLALARQAAVRAAGNDPEKIETKANLARQLVDGNLLPGDLAKRGVDYNAVLAEANKISIKETGKSWNAQQAKLNYEAAKRHVSSMNAPQRQAFLGLASSVDQTIDEVKALSDELKQGGIQLWNKASRNTVLQLYGNTPQSETAVRYINALNTLKEEYAQLATGGYAPQEAAWKLANEQINKDLGMKDLNAAISESQRLIRFRIKGLQELQPTYSQGPGTPTAPPAAPVNTRKRSLDEIFGK